MATVDDRRPTSRIGQFLITVSGARPEVLARCPTEGIKFQSLGWAILITTSMATVSMWFALTSAMGFNPVLSVPVAVLWGLIIMGIDRWLVTSMPLDGRRKLAIAAPRLALAILLGSLISTPIVLRIFQSEINNQVSIIKENNEASFLSSQQHSAVAARVTKWQSTVNNLQQVIDSHGQKAIDPASDKVVQGLTSQLNSERKVAAADYHAWQCQLYGGCGAPKGSGPLAAASQKRYDADEAQVTKLTQEIQAREQSLRATDANSQKSRLRQANSSLPSAQAQLKAAQAEENSLLNNFQSTNSATNGLLIRLKALDQLSAGSSTLQTARILLFLLFLVIEVLPVTVKLLQPQGNYEKILRREVANELRKAQWDMRGGRQPDTAPRPADEAFRESTRYSQRDPLDVELDNVWHQYSKSAGQQLSSGDQHTRTEPVHNWERRADTEYIPATEDAAGPGVLDDILRQAPDVRSPGSYEERLGSISHRYTEGGVPGSYEERLGGIERSYAEEDL